jgi:type I restriction enzyme S subunit
MEGFDPNSHEWRSAKLGRAAGLTVRKPKPFRGNRFYLATADVDAGAASPNEEFTFENRPARAGLQLAEDDVLQAKMIATNKALLVSAQQAGWLASTGFALFSPRQADSIPAYFYHWLQSNEFHRQKDRLCVGSTQKAISQTDLAAIALRVPERPEQARISAILDAVNKQIEVKKAVITKLQRVRAGLLQDFLTRGLDADGHLRDPIAHPEQFQDSALGRIPCAWTVQTLEQITDPQSPICYGIVQVFDFVPTGVLVLAIRDILGDYATGLHRTAASIDALYARSRVRPGDVLISIKGTIGRIGLVPPHYVGNISRDLARLRPVGRISSSFLVHLLRSPLGQRTLEIARVGTTRGELSIAPLKRIAFAFPQKEEQDEIAEILEEQDVVIATHNAELAKLVQLRSGLMADLLTGRVRAP